MTNYDLADGLFGLALTAEANGRKDHAEHLREAGKRIMDFTRIEAEEALEAWLADDADYQSQRGLDS